MLNKQESAKDKLNSLITSDVQNIKAEIGSKREEITVHPMPSKFVAAASQSKHAGTGKGGGSKGKKLALIAIVLILVIIIGVAVVIFFANKTVETPELVQEVVQNVNEAKNTNVNEVEDNKVLVNENTNVNEVEDNKVLVNENTNENLNIPELVDSDNDGLSYEEELVFATDPDIEDTDRDGYKDGQEITGLYNPLVSGQGLAESGLVTKFTNGSYSYTFLRPSAWLVSPIGQGTSQLAILPNSETGESFTIDASSNVDNKTLTEVLDSMRDILGPSVNYQNYNLAGVSAYRSLDGQKVLALNNNFIFVISHETSPFGAVNFASIFEMLLNSFNFMEVITPGDNVQ